MSILVPAALGFSAIIPIILVLYFMRPKRQERIVGSTLLWQQAMQDLQASRPWQRLRITPLLLLQLLAALAIILVLARPAFFFNSPISGNTIVILQSSASMQATDVSPNRFANAKNIISDFINELGPNDHLSLLTMARIPQVLVSASQDKAQLQSALQRASVTNEDADLEQTISLAGSLASQQTDSQVIVVGDGHVIQPEQPIVTAFPVRYVSVGTNAPNIALLALSSRTVQGKLIAFAQISNYSQQQRAVPVELYTDNKLFGVQTVNLPPNGSGTIQWGPLNPQTTLLHARLISQDALSVDHDGWSIVGSSIHGRVLLVTKNNIYLEAALKLQPNVDLYETTPDKYSSLVPYDLTIFDDYTPPLLPGGSILFINPPIQTYDFGTSGQLSGVSHIAAGADTLNLLNDVDLSSIHTLHTTHILKPALWAQVIMSSPETPLLIAGETNNRREAAIGFDLHDTDLPLQPSFPILISNLISWFLPSPAGTDNQITAGTPITIQTWPGATQVTVTNPARQTTTVAPPFPVSPYTNTNATGIYEVDQQVQGRLLKGIFAVNMFNANQSRLAPAKELPVNHSTNITTDSSGISRQLREIWPWIAATLLLILCIEWWLFSRNYQSQGNAQTQKQKKRAAAGNIKQRLRSDFLADIEDSFHNRLAIIRKRSKKIKKRIQTRLKTQTKGDRHAHI